MSDNHITRCSISLIISKMQIEIIIRYQYTPILNGLNNVKRDLKIPSNGEDAKHLEISFIAGENGAWHSLFGKKFGRYPIKRDIYLLYNLGIPCLCNYSGEMKVYIHAKTCM